MLLVEVRETMALLWVCGAFVGSWHCLLVTQLWMQVWTLHSIGLASCFLSFGQKDQPFYCWWVLFFTYLTVPGFKSPCIKSWVYVRPNNNNNNTKKKKEREHPTGKPCVILQVLRSLVSLISFSRLQSSFIIVHIIISKILSFIRKDKWEKVRQYCLLWSWWF